MPLVGIYLEKSIVQKHTCIPVFIAALFTITGTCKQPKCLPAGEWTHVWYIYTVEYYSGTKVMK